MYKKKYTLFLIFFSFFLSILVSNFLLSNYDRYEVSTDNIENHSYIKGDLPDIWAEGQIIKDDLEKGKNYLNSGGEVWRSYLPPRIIAAYSLIKGYSLFSDWDNKIINSEKGKFEYLIFQALIFSLSLIFLYNVLIKYYPENTVFFTIAFLALIPNIFLFHSSFHTESIFFTLQIFLLGLMMQKKQTIIHNLLIGLVLGVSFLQKTTMIYYGVPLGIYFIFIHRKKFLVPLISSFIGFFIILSFVGYGNFKRIGIFYVMPNQAKHAVHFYMASYILSESLNITPQEAAKIKNNDERKWRINNEIDLNNELDRIKYYNYLQKYSYKIFINNPVPTVKFMVYKSLQTAMLNPVYIFHFLRNENKTDPPYYHTKEYKNFWFPVRIIYSLFIYSIVLIGFFTLLKKENLSFNILLVLTSLYFFIMLGWVGNARYFCPILIYLSIYFGNGIVEISKKFKT